MMHVLGLLLNRLVPVWLGPLAGHATWCSGDADVASLDWRVAMQPSQPVACCLLSTMHALGCLLHCLVPVLLGLLQAGHATWCRGDADVASLDWRALIHLTPHVACCLALRVLALLVADVGWALARQTHLL